MLRSSLVLNLAAIRISQTALMYPAAWIHSQRFSLNFSGVFPGHLDFFKAPQEILMCSPAHPRFENLFFFKSSLLSTLGESTQPSKAKEIHLVAATNFLA